MNSSLVESITHAVGGGDCLVALGGGADSAVLLHTAVDALGTDRVTAVFVYHGLEGSSMLRSAATAVADRCGVSCLVIDSVVDEGGNLEARARAARYQAIEAIAPAGTVVLSGHTANDQVETVLMRLARGSGSGAIGGIPQRRGVWRRPFLDESRASLRAIAQELELPFADDPANVDRRFVRARVRHDLLPVMTETFGPETNQRMLRSAALLGDDEELLASAAREIPIHAGVMGVSIPTGPLVTSARPVATRAVRRALRLILDDYPGGASDVDAVLSVASGGSTRSISTGLIVAHEPPFVTIHPQVDIRAPEAIEIRVGDRFDWCGEGYVTYATEHPPPAVAVGRFTVLSAAAVRDGFGLRGFQPGDGLEISAGTTPVKELLRSAGVPARLRPHSPVVTVDAKIAAVVGVRVASWARAKRGDDAVIIEREVDTWISTSN